jgi:hypothetical protein
MKTLARRCLSPLVLTLALSAAAAARKPAWVSGPDPRYPDATYATGVGVGNDLDAARANARGEISRSFQARVQQTLTDVQTESSASSGKRRGAALGTQKSESHTQVTTDTLLEGVVIKETWFEKNSKKHYALAVLDKAALRKALSLQIIEKEQVMNMARTKAEQASDPVVKIRELSRCLAAARERDELSTRRRVVDPAGMAELSGGSTAQVEAAWDRAAAALPVAVTAEAPEGSALARAVTSALTDLGLQVGPPSNAGLGVKATLAVAPFDRGNPDWTFFQWTGGISVTDMAAGRVVASASPDGVEGHLTAATARAKTQNAGEQTLAQEAARLVGEYLFGK